MAEAQVGVLTFHLPDGNGRLRTDPPTMWCCQLRVTFPVDGVTKAYRPDRFRRLRLDGLDTEFEQAPSKLLPEQCLKQRSRENDHVFVSLVAADWCAIRSPETG